MNHINTDVKISGYWIRLPYKRKVDKEMVLSTFERATTEALGILRRFPNNYNFIEIFELIDSKSGYYERVFKLKAKFFNN